MVMIMAVIMFVVEQFVPLSNSAERAICCGAFYKPFVLAGEWWRLLTVMFLHGSILHLLMNLFSLYNMGMALEPRLGTRKFATILLGSTIGGSLFVLISNGSVVSVGMSGGLYGIMACMIYVMARGGLLRDPFLRRDLLSTLFVNLLINFMPGIAWQAHLGGFITGLFLTASLLKDNDKSITRNWRLAAAVYMAGIVALAGVNWNMDGQNVYAASDLNVLQVYDKAGMHGHSMKIAESLDHIYGISYLEAALQMEDLNG